MIALIFEVVISHECEAEYLAIAEDLFKELPAIEGFVSIERFRSIVDPKKLLSLSYWESEEALSQWRNLESHRIAQRKGRTQIFANYTLNVATVQRSYGKNDRGQAPNDSRITHG